MALLKSIPLPGRFSASYIQFNRVAEWSKAAKTARLIFAVWPSKEVADAYKANPYDPDNQPACFEAIELTLRGAAFDAYFPQGVPDAAAFYEALKEEPVSTWRGIESSDTPVENRLLYGAQDV